VFSCVTIKNVLVFCAVLCHAGEFINITCFAPFVFFSQPEVKYNTITPVVKKSYGLYFESKIDDPSFSCFLFMLFSV
jgi:hypothetical protein